MKVLVDISEEQLKKWLHEKREYDTHEREMVGHLTLVIPTYKREHPPECECWKRTDEGRGRCFQTVVRTFEIELPVNVIHS